MLERKDRATLDQLVEATGWQPHTVRGALARGAEEAARADGRVGEGRGRRVYRIEGFVTLTAARAKRACIDLQAAATSRHVANVNKIIVRAVLASQAVTDGMRFLLSPE